MELRELYKQTQLIHTKKLVIINVAKHEIIPMTISGLDAPPDRPVIGINISMTR